MLIGGGRAFGPRPKGPDGWKRKVNRKEERLGLQVALSDKWRRGDLSIVENLGMLLPSTSLLHSGLASNGWVDSLFILGTQRAAELEESKRWFELSSRNLGSVALVGDATKLGIWELVKHRKVIIELSAVDEVIKRLDPETLWDLEAQSMDDLEKQLERMSTEEEDDEEQEEELDEKELAAIEAEMEAASLDLGGQVSKP